MSDNITQSAAEAAIGQGNEPFSMTPVEAALPAEEKPNMAQKADWGDPVPYNYNAYTKDATHEWESNTARYEWDGDYGDVGPEFPELELQLFGDPTLRGKKGIDFSTIDSIEVFQEGPARIDPITKFEDAGLHPVMLKNVQLAGYDAPTPIQRYCLPAIHNGYDVIGIAQTGSGKTAAYLVPILSKLMGKAKKLAAPRPNPATYKPGVDAPVTAEPLVVIVAPTRELAVQIFNEARKFCYRTMLRPCVVYGGGTFRDQQEQLGRGCDVLIGTPGRLVDFLERPAVLTLRRMRYIVIDEADEMLAEDWKPQLDKIMAGGDQEEGTINYMLFSATFPKAARDLAKTHLADTHVRLRVGRAGSTHRNIVQDVIEVAGPKKKQALLDYMNDIKPQRVIIFANSKRTVEELDDLLYKNKFPCTSIHGDRNQKEREASMRAFRSGDCPVLITTGVSARGIDVRNVFLVINYDLPSMDHGGIEEYTHRIGRTGRIGHHGVAVSFYDPARDEPIASVLTRTLLETDQEVPDFLKPYVPEGVARENLKFEADSDFDEDAGAAGAAGDAGDAGEGWGSGWGTSAEGAEGAEVPNNFGPAQSTDGSVPAW